jgi:hypothetical protein
VCIRHTNKRRILHRALNVSKPFCKDIVKACVILHNVVRVKEFRSEDILLAHLQDLNRTTWPRPTKNATDIRDRFAHYFVSPAGALPWQMNKIQDVPAKSLIISGGYLSTDFYEI